MLREPAETPPTTPPDPARALVRPCARAQVPQTAAEVPAGAPVDMPVDSRRRSKTNNEKLAVQRSLTVSKGPKELRSGSGSQRTEKVSAVSAQQLGTVSYS